MERTLLLVDDEENILHALLRLLRRDGYTILTAHGGAEGLAVLAEQPVGVILSDQRMPEMSGVEFLEHAKEIQPDTVRLMLSGYTELHAVTDAINRGSIYRFITKPWDDEVLRASIRQAFEQFEQCSDEHETAQQLRAVNEGLQQQVEVQGKELSRQQQQLRLSKAVLEQLPVGVLGVDTDGVVALANNMACHMLASASDTLLGRHALDVLPDELRRICARRGDAVGDIVELALGTANVHVHCSPMAADGRTGGNVLVLVPQDVNEL